MKALVIFLDFMNGRFGKYELVDSIRWVWKIITWVSLVVLVFRFIIFPFFDLWDKAIRVINYIIWG